MFDITRRYTTLGNVYDSIVGAENVSPQAELKRLDEQIDAVTELDALKPIFIRLNEILQTYSGDFDVQFAGIETRRRLMARGTQLLEEASQSPPIAPLHERAPVPASPAPPPPIAPFPPPAARPPEPFEPVPAAPTEPFMAPPAAFGIPPATPPRPPSRPPAPPPRPRKSNLLAVIGSAAGVLVLAAIIVAVVSRTGNRKASHAAAVPVDIVTTPPGATVTVSAGPSGAGGNQAGCISNCKLSLAPGTYQVSTSLSGFEPMASAITVVAGQPAALSLTLPQAQSARVLTDLARGKVMLDHQPPVDLQEGWLILDKLAPGTHTVKVSGQNGDASFAFEIAPGRPPAVTGPVTARNMIAVLVASYGKQARIVTNAGPWKLTVNGQPQSDASPAGTDLTSFQPGVNEIVVGKDKDQRNMSETFGAAPMLTAFLKTDVNAGTLIVSTGQDDVRVFLNGREYRGRTQRGQLRIQTLGKVTVRVTKSGYQDEPPQTAEVKKGAEVRLEFAMKQQPQVGSLQIQGAAAGTEVLLDQKPAGRVGPDGSLTLGSVQPGDHTVELRREQLQPKRLQRTFRAGQAVVLAGAEVALAAATGTVRLTRNPPSVVITYRRSDETESHEARGNQVELPPGSYVFLARAPGFVEATARVQLGPGETREWDLALSHERPTTPPPTGGMTEFEDAESWKKDGDSWSHKGGGFVPYKLPPKGVFTFTAQLLKGGGVFRAGQIRWYFGYIDSRNYLLYEVDRKSFWAGVVEKGKRLERVKTPLNLGNQKSFTMQIEVTPDRLVQKIRVGDEWRVLDTFVEPGRDFTQGKFGFLILGNDEIAISDFKFVPK